MQEPLLDTSQASDQLQTTVTTLSQDDSFSGNRVTIKETTIGPDLEAETSEDNNEGKPLQKPVQDFQPQEHQPYLNLNYTWPSRSFVNYYKKPNDRFNEAALSFRSLGREKLQKSFSKKFEIVFCAVFLFIPRIVLGIIFFIIKICLTKILMIGLPEQDEPYTKPQVNGWRRYMYYAGLVVLRGFYIVFGIYWVETKGAKRASQKDAPIRVYAPHTGWLDTIVQCDWPINDPLHPVVNDSMKSMPIITPTEPLFVNRTTPDAKKFMKESIISRATYNPPKNQKTGNVESRRWDPIMINPQGCCSSACLTNFKTGAFSAGLPVQPVYMEYPEKIDIYSWQWIDGQKNHHPLTALIYGLLRYRCKLICHYLDVYYPSQAEIDDPQLYAYNVRKVIAEYSKLPIIDTCFEDTIFLDKLGSKYGLDPNYCLIEFLRLRNNYDCNSRFCMEILENYLEKFIFKRDSNNENSKMCNSKTGEVNIKNFSKFVNESEMFLEENYFKNLKYYDRKFINLPTVLEAELRWRRSGKEAMF